MYSFLGLVDYYFNTELENSKFIKHVQNAHTFIVSIGCGVGLYYYETYSSGETMILMTMQKAILAQCTFDLLLNSRPDIFIHHVITISMVVFSLMSQPTQSIQYMCAVIISCELSSMFLVLNYYIEHHTLLSAINTGCFISTFFYTRLYLYTREILFLTSSQHNIWYTVNIYSFFGINLYWGSILVKSMYKKIRRLVKIHHTKINTEYLLQITMFVPPYISGCVYYYNEYYTVITLTDLISLVAVSISSYNYHNALYATLSMSTTDKVNVLSDAIYPYYISDIFIIHMRSCLIVSASLSQLHDDGLRNIVILSTVLFHALTLRIFYDYHSTKKAGKHIIIYDGDETIASLIVKLPLFVDACICAYNCVDATIQNHLIISILMICATMVVKPFYEMNHFFFHVLLIYQSSAATLSIVTGY